MIVKHVEQCKLIQAELYARGHLDVFYTKLHVHIAITVLMVMLTYRYDRQGEVC